MAGGRKIDDHSFWAGGRSKNTVLAEGVKFKSESSAEGAGHLGEYEDTTEAIKGNQMTAEKKIKAHPAKPGYRN